MGRGRGGVRHHILPSGYATDNNTSMLCEGVMHGMHAYGVAALLLESVLYELVEQAGLPRTR